MRHPARAALAVVLLALSASASQSPPPQVPTFGATTELVYVRFHVEKKGIYAKDLEPGQIRVLEDGRPQQVVLLETPATQLRSIPPQVTLLLDVSSSVMDARLLDESMLRDVFFPVLSEQTTVGLCAFGAMLRCFAEPTRDVADLVRGFQLALEFGRERDNQGTRLYGSVQELAAPPEGEPVQRALVVFSDGIDNRSGSEKDAAEAAQRGELRVYPVLLSQAIKDPGLTLRPGGGMTGPGGGFGGSQSAAMYGYMKLDLLRLAEDTGGRAYEPATLDRGKLEEILRSIANEITMECVVGYQPEGPATGKKRKIKVELADKSLGKVRGGERTLVR
jgi:VWFA-related protein